MPTKRVASPELARVQQLAAGLEGIQTKVGWFEGNKYPDGTPVAYVAAVQEFGYAEGNIPPRPYFRPTIEAEQKKWATIIGDGARKVIKGSMTPHQALDRVGLVAAGDVRAAIAAVTTPALAPSTLAARKARGNGSAKPLVDTRVMLPTLTHVTESAGEA